MKKQQAPLPLAPLAADVQALRQQLGSNTLWSYVEVRNHSAADLAITRWPRLAESLKLNAGSTLG